MNLARKFFNRISPRKHDADSALDNVSYNKTLWDSYSKHWHKKSVFIEDGTAQDANSYLTYLGDEWGTKQDVATVVKDFIDPFIDTSSVALEIGVGGGRIASKVAPQVKKFYALDVSHEMVKRAQGALVQYKNIEYRLQESSSLPLDLSGRIDFIYSFDVFVHLDLHNIWQYLHEIKRTLTPQGRAFLHTANLAAPKGWERFSNQKAYKVEGHYFISPEIIDIFCQHLSLEIERKSSVDINNFYYARDYLFVIKRA